MYKIARYLKANINDEIEAEYNHLYQMFDKVELIKQFLLTKNPDVIKDYIKTYPNDKFIIDVLRKYPEHSSINDIQAIKNGLDRNFNISIVKLQNYNNKYPLFVKENKPKKTDIQLQETLSKKLHIWV